jgi:putative membrane protein
MYGYGGSMFGGGLGMILMWLVPIALVIWLVSSWGKHPEQGPAAKTALDILKERYAKGEIGKDEFEGKKHDIGA